MQKKGTIFFVRLRRALAPSLRFILEHCGPLRFLGVTLMSWYLKPVVQWDGHTVSVDPTDFGVTFELESTGEYEATTMSLCKKLLQPGMVFVDVGANIGLFTLMAARQVGPAGHVYSFEPGAANCVLLRKNVEQNGYHNVTPVQKAVTDRSGSAILHQSGFNKADHRTYHVSKGRKQVAIECVSLDEYFPPDARIDVIKMDIEGAEGAALRGMQRILRSPHPPKLVMECWPPMLVKAGTDPLRLLQSLEEMGFALSLIDDAADVVTPLDAASILKICEEHDVGNVLCVRR
ncbi:MAG: FkbM family methyltransferase [Candidatus Peribacteraceae bacterium]|jgi:FkbM family methyltransferase